MQRAMKQNLKRSLVSRNVNENENWEEKISKGIRIIIWKIKCIEIMVICCSQCQSLGAIWMIWKMKKQKKKSKHSHTKKENTIYVCIIVYRHHVTITYLMQAIHAKLNNNIPIHIHRNHHHVIQTTIHTVVQKHPLIHQLLNVKVQLDQAVTTIQLIVHHQLVHVPVTIHTAQPLQAVCHMAQPIAIIHIVFKILFLFISVFLLCLLPTNEIAPIQHTHAHIHTKVGILPIFNPILVCNWIKCKYNFWNFSFLFIEIHLFRFFFFNVSNLIFSKNEKNERQQNRLNQKKFFEPFNAYQHCPVSQFTCYILHTCNIQQISKEGMKKSNEFLSKIIRSESAI